MMVWWAVAAVAAFFIKGLCGFANTLVFTSILSFSNNNSVISPVELLLGYPTNMILAWKERRSIKWSICIPLSILVVMGSIPGILFLKNADGGMIKIFFDKIIIITTVSVCDIKNISSTITVNKFIIIVFYRVREKCIV